MLASLISILERLAADGYQDIIVEQLQTRLDQYLTQLPKKKTYSDSRRESAESIAIALYKLLGITVFFATLERMGTAMLQSALKTPFFYDWLLMEVIETEGVDSLRALIKRHRITSPGVLHIAERVDRDNAIYKSNREQPTPSHTNNMSPDHVIAYLQSQRFFTTYSAEKLLPYTDTAMHKTIALHIAAATPEHKIKLMRFFKYVDFPLGIEPLLAYLASAENEDFRTVLYSVLSRFSDARIHALAYDNLYKRQDIPESLGLLKHNLYPTDIPILVSTLHQHREKLVSYDFHCLVMKIIPIMEHNTHSDFAGLYRLIHERNRCAYCRKSIIKALCSNDYAEQYRPLILQCVDDSNSDTRQIAMDYLTA